MKILRRRLILSVLALSVSLSGNSMVTMQSWAQGPAAPPLQVPIFSETCTQANKDALLIAHENMGLMLDDALDGASNEFDSKEYRESFGAPHPDRDYDVLGRLLLMRIGASVVSMTANCVQKGQDTTCDKGVWAYVPKAAAGPEAQNHVINFCYSYFSATDELVQRVSLWEKVSMMQGAVFLHELTHFTWETKELLESVGMHPDANTHITEGTIDKRYNADRVKKLAERHPEKAIVNADSYHIFVVKLAMRKGTIYK